MASLICLQCGAAFECKPSRIAQGKGKYCSRACRTASTGGLTKLYPKEYGVFCTAKARCKGTQKEKRDRYMQRGVEFRFASFAEFISVVGPRPDGMQLDRIDNNGHYEPGNVRWASPSTQANNRECTVTLTHNGKTLPLAEWSKITGIPYDTLHARIHRYGWDIKDALETARYGKYG